MVGWFGGWLSSVQALCRLRPTAAATACQVQDIVSEQILLNFFPSTATSKHEIMQHSPAPRRIELHQDRFRTLLDHVGKAGEDPAGGSWVGRR